MIAWKTGDLWVFLGDDIEIHPSKNQIKFISKSKEAREYPESVNIWIKDREQLKRIRRALKRVHQQLLKAEAKQKKKAARPQAPTGTAEAFAMALEQTPESKRMFLYHNEKAIEERRAELESEKVLMDHERQELREIAAGPGAGVPGSFVYIECEPIKSKEKT